jgi:o-succinylbenzoate---CoA ligase
LTQLSSNDTWLLSLSLSHVAGLLIVYRCFLVGASVFIPDSRSFKSLFNELLSPKITAASLIPEILKGFTQKLPNENLSHLRFLMLGGNKIDKSDESLFFRTIKTKIIHTYGMTETCSHIAARSLGVDSFKILPSSLVKIKSDYTGDIGKVLIKSRYLSEITITKDGAFKLLDKNGFYSTNDLGYLDSKNNLFIVGRDDSIIISGGEKIDLLALATKFKDISNVKQSVAIGFKHSIWGERPILFLIVRYDEKRSVKNTILNEAYHIKLKLKGIYKPNLIFIIEDKYMSQIGKVNYTKIKTDFQKLIETLFNIID